MPRNRSQATDTKENTSTMSNMFTPIDDADVLAEILAGSHGRGDYKTVLSAFIDAGIRLAQIPLDSGIFQGRKPQTVKSGFENVKSSKEPPAGADQVKVVKKNDQVYLVNQAVTTA